MPSDAPPSSIGFQDPFPSERPTMVDEVERVSVPSANLPKTRPLLTVLSGPEKGAVFRVPDGQVTLGRSQDAIVSIADPGLSRIHARLISFGNGFVLDDAGSTNGTFVEDKKVTGPTPIAPGARFRLGKRTLVSLTLHDELGESAALSVHEAALRDRLTGAYNRGVFDDRLVSEVAFAKRHGSELSVLLFDVDHFKSFNDTHGHQLGDEVLIAVSKTVTETVRTEDTFARYGGEEFVVIARSTPAGHATILGERIRRAVDACRVPSEEGPLKVTVSVGISTYPFDESLSLPPPSAPLSRPPQSVANATGEVERSLIKQADAALYAAKRQGRNRVLHITSVTTP